MKKTKQKTRKSASKRFKITGSGKVLHRSKGARHKLSKKSKRTIRRLRQDKEVEGTFKKKIKQMVGEA